MSYFTHSYQSIFLLQNYIVKYKKMALRYLYMAGGTTPLPGLRFQCRTATRFSEVCLEVLAGSKWPYKGISQTETKGYWTASQFWIFHCLIRQGQAFCHMLRHLTKGVLEAKWKKAKWENLMNAINSEYTSTARKTVVGKLNILI